METAPGAQAVSRALRLLRAVAGTLGAGISLPQLMRGTGLDEPAVHRLVLARISVRREYPNYSSVLLWSDVAFTRAREYSVSERLAVTCARTAR
ncbi:helix-turn-helix domain-containing protein [Paraburkholderia sp. 1N]|uniref:Helix-turn-helix domain-containing protein n=1 Tax=Paraburkholderia solitsugae TaxID=2675748 RepID=A0ABX2C069_9BURK|nr:helix-turn-helix domain-containing protein [Paraburkholderia solitsugae]